MTRSVMVWGTSSGAGKSLLATALCRWAARRGVDVAPYKAQNMSNNARVVPGQDGELGEIGAAQYFQALAARVAPHVDMNPVLLKPERDTASQVVVLGKADPALSALPWRKRSVVLADAARRSFERLSRQHELVVIEGAGSPAEVNLSDHDYVNLHAARWASACGQFDSLLVTDIDRGGAFAHLYGTWSMLPEDLGPTLRGFVLNKFRGDPCLLAPGPEMLRSRTGVPVLGLLPMQRDHGLPEEDGMHDQAYAGAASNAAAPRGLRVAIVAAPRISNLDEFHPLRLVPGLRLIWARHASDLHGVDWIVLPGSKQVSSDLAWLRARGMDVEITSHAAAGRPVLGICGGLQMLGSWLSDPDGIDGEALGQRPGLSLLPLGTTYAAPKRLTQAHVRFTAMQRPWHELSNLDTTGYEIRCGETRPLAHAPALTALVDEHGAAIGWQSGPVLGVYAHGLFESAAVMRALFGTRVRTLDDSLDGLAELVDRHFEPGSLDRLLKGKP